MRVELKLKLSLNEVSLFDGSVSFLDAVPHWSEYSPFC